ncbi:MAG: hypothetical protein HY542_07955 [Deltaproteobacteria bacterium]|nr:hypothetical protein [Deltaproteobacteria bacterium]
MGVQPTAFSPSSRFEELFCESFDSKPPETLERTFIDLLATAVRRAGFSYPTKSHIVGQVLKAGGSVRSPLVRQFFGDHDFYFRATFHEGRVPRDSWTGDLTWEEGAKLALNARSRNGQFQVSGDVWMEGVEVLYGLDIGALTRRKRPLSFWNPIQMTDRVRLLLPHFRHRGWPTYDLTDEMRRFGLGRSILGPVPIEEVFTVSPDKVPAARKKTFDERPKWVQGPLATLDDLQVTVDYRPPRPASTRGELGVGSPRFGEAGEAGPPPNRERVGRSNLHLDWQRVLETLKSGRFLRFDFDGIHGDSYANFYDVPADLLIPNAEGNFDLRWSYDPSTKTTSLLASDIDLVASIPSGGGSAVQPTLALWGQVEVLLKYPDQVEINFENLEYDFENVSVSGSGLMRSSGQLNSHLQVDLGGESPVIRKGWVDVDRLTIESEDGGPIQFQVGETTMGAQVDDGRLFVDFDPDRPERPVDQEMELRGSAYSHGPKNNFDLSNLRVSIRSPLNLVDLRLEAQADLRIRSEGGPSHDVRAVRVALAGVPSTTGRGPQLLATVRADSVPLFHRELFLDSSTLIWSEPRGKSCQVRWDGQASLRSSAVSGQPVDLATALFGSSDFETVWLKVIPAFQQVFSDWTFRGFTEGKASFRTRGVGAILEGLKRQSSFQTTREGASIGKGRKELVKGLTCEWKGMKREGSLRCRAKKVGHRVKVEKADVVFPWDTKWFHLANGEITIRLDDRSLQLVRGLDLTLTGPGRIRSGEFQTDTIGGLCLSGFLNPRAAAFLGDQVELVQEGGEWVYLRRCGKRLPLNRLSLLGGQ